MARRFVSACFRLLLRWALVCALTGAAGARAQVPAVDLDEAARRLAAGGYVMMMRHAQTEAGIGDPPGFRLDDCSTQRNLSAEGREQARQAGAAMAAAGIRVAVVRSSGWCRCRETAELAFGGHEQWPALNSFFGDRSVEPERTRSVVEFARALRAPSNAMLVTHQVNITAVFGGWVSPGEVVAGRWRDGRLAAEFRFLPQAR